MSVSKNPSDYWTTDWNQENFRLLQLAPPSLPFAPLRTLYTHLAQTAPDNMNLEYVWYGREKGGVPKPHVMILTYDSWVNAVEPDQEEKFEARALEADRLGNVSALRMSWINVMFRAAKFGEYHVNFSVGSLSQVTEEQSMYLSGVDARDIQTYTDINVILTDIQIRQQEGLLKGAWLR